MVVKPRGSVTIPNRPIAVGGLLSWAKAVNMALRQLRDRSIVVNGASRPSSSRSDYIPWDANLFTEGAEPSITYKVRFNLGTLNNVAASNWDSEHTLPDATTARFVILEVTSADGKVTGLTISLSATPLTEDFVNKDVPPTTHKILLGVISGTSKKMIETTNLNAEAAEIFRESKVAPAVGAEPFSRWWRWSHTSV